MIGLFDFPMIKINSAARLLNQDMCGRGDSGKIFVARDSSRSDEPGGRRLVTKPNTHRTYSNLFVGKNKQRVCVLRA